MSLNVVSESLLQELLLAQPSANLMVEVPAFMAVDPRRHKLYFAQRSENPEPSTWPAIKTWPADVRQAKEAVLGP